MESRPDQPISSGVLDCLEYFEFASSPQDSISFFDQRRYAATSGDVGAVNDFCDVMTALALYPEDCQANPWPATELYMAFARSQDPYHVERVVGLIPKLWDVDPDGASRITEECMLRPSATPQDERIHESLVSLVDKSYQMGRMLVRSQTEDGIVLLSAERLKRRSPPRAS